MSIHPSAFKHSFAELRTCVIDRPAEAIDCSFRPRSFWYLLAFDYCTIGSDFLVLSCLALVLMFVVLDDSDNAADDDGFLDETHCDCEE
jgi:hypothetical protein